MFKETERSKPAGSIAAIRNLARNLAKTQSSTNQDFLGVATLEIGLFGLAA